MARINTKEKLVDYIKTTLGEPIIRVDVSTQQISQIIDHAVMRFTEYSYGTLEETVVLQINGMGEYILPDTITNILRLSQGSTSNLTNFSANFGAGYVPNLWSEQFFSGSLTGDIIPAIIGISTTKAMLDKYFGDEIVYNFNPHKKTLKVLQNFVGPAVLHYQYEYLANENGDFIYNHEWIKDYVVAKCRYQWGNNTGKLEQTLVGGARINYADMKSEATVEIERLDGELLTKWSDPVPIAIG
jgi:hypothetical protein